MANSYKALKEEFVSNLTGGEISEINYVTAVAPAAVLLWSVLQARQNLFVRYGAAAVTVDFLLNVGAILLAITLYSSGPLVLDALLVAPALLLFPFPQAPAAASRLARPSQVNGKPQTAGLDLFPMRPFLSAYRGSMIIITCLAILAVDFRIFPRRFAKVETWGSSLMDLGVGSFVFSAGVVAAKPLLRDRLLGRSLRLGRRVYVSMKHALPLFILGIVRLYSVKGMDYAEHVSEYGVHWNFFFTLAFLPPFVALFQTFFQLIPSYAALALLLSGIYEVLLEYTTLKAFVLVAPRTDLFTQNREGIFSFAGYLAIFLAGQATGMYILPRRVGTAGRAETPTAQRRGLLLRLTAWSIGWSALYFLATSYRFGLGLQVSRRLANLCYMLWVCAFNCGQLAVFCLIETLLFPKVYKAGDGATERREASRATSLVLHSFNRNGLAIFLVANVLTGRVNVWVDTLQASTTQAMSILVGYASILTAVALALHARDISIKL